MYPALVIASQFINKGIAEGKPVTPMKLQKLIYFAHGLHLARHEKPLIKEPVEAWTYGPVIPDIYYRFKKWGNNPITKSGKIGFWEDDSFVDEGDVLDRQAQDTLKMTWDITKDFSAIQLSNWTHTEGSPWYQAVSRNENGVAEYEPIDNSLIKEYFTEIIRTHVGE